MNEWEVKMEFTGERLVPGMGGDELQTEHEHRYHAVAPLLSGMKVLDAACGTGYGSDIIADYATSVIGLDISTDAIAYATEHYQKPKFVVASIDNMPFDGDDFDAVVSFETIEHVEQELQIGFLDEVSRVLKPNGLFIISTVNKAVYTDKRNQKNEFHLKEYYLPEFKKLLKKRFKTVEFFIQSFGVYSSILNEDAREAKLLGDITGSLDNFGMYVIAVCTDGELNENINSLLFYCQDYESYFTDGVIWKQRYSDLHSSFDERTQWALRLDDELSKKNLAFEKLTRDKLQIELKLAESNTYEHLYNDLHSQFDERTQWAIRLDSELSARNLELENMKKDKSAIESKLSDYINENNALRQHNGSLEQQIIEMCNSKTWRYGKRLQKLFRFFVPYKKV